MKKKSSEATTSKIVRDNKRKTAAAPNKEKLKTFVKNKTQKVK